MQSRVLHSFPLSKPRLPASYAAGTGAGDLGPATLPTVAGICRRCVSCCLRLKDEASQQCSSVRVCSPASDGARQAVCYGRLLTALWASWVNAKDAAQPDV